MAEFDYSQYEDRSRCAACGGYCCKSCGCNYFVSDIKPFTSENIEKMLDSGDVSIGTMPIRTEKFDGSFYYSFMLVLRARNKNRGDIDLFSLTTSCASLGPTGCKHDAKDRPSGGLLYIPRYPFECKPAFDVEKEFLKWHLYQQMLALIVQKRCGKPLAVKFSEDVENFFYDMYGRHFDDVLLETVEEMIVFLDQFSWEYPNERLRAMERLAEEYKARNRTNGGQNVR